MKHTKGRILYQAVTKGLIRNQRNVNLIRVSRLETSLYYFKLDLLAKAVAISLCEDIPEQRGATFIQAMRCASIKDWTNIAVVINNQGQLQAVDFSILKSCTKQLFIEEHPEFSQALTSQLTILSKIGNTL